MPISAGQGDADVLQPPEQKTLENSVQYAVAQVASRYQMRRSGALVQGVLATFGCRFWAGVHTLSLT